MIALCGFSLRFSVTNELEDFLVCTPFVKYLFKSAVHFFHWIVFFLMFLQEFYFCSSFCFCKVKLQHYTVSFLDTLFANFLLSWLHNGTVLGFFSYLWQLHLFHMCFEYLICVIHCWHWKAKNSLTSWSLHSCVGFLPLLTLNMLVFFRVLLWLSGFSL